MELHWPLILFTLFTAWSAGLFGMQALMAFNGAGQKSQFIAWVSSAVLLVIGGIAVFLHLQHWERIFNGFGNITSGITQELIAIVVLGIVAIAYLVMMRKSEDGASVPKWLAIAAMVVSLAVVAVMAHSYVMAARPVWDTTLWIACVVGSALILGSSSMALIMAVREDDLEPMKLACVIAVGLGALAMVGFAAFAQTSTDSFTSVGYYFDTTNPMQAAVDTTAAISAQAPLLWGGGVALGGIIPLIAAGLAFKKVDAKTWKMTSAIALVAGIIGAICMRVAFFELGFSVYMFF